MRRGLDPAALAEPHRGPRLQTHPDQKRRLRESLARVVCPPGAHHNWMAILLIVMIGKVTEWVPGISGLPLAKVAFFFTVVCAYGLREKLAPVKVRSLPIAKPALAFLVLSILSVLFSIYHSETLRESQGTLIYLVTFVVLVKITQTIPDVERLLLALVGSSISLSAGVLTHYSGGQAHINSNFDPNDISYVLDTLLPIVIALGVAHSKLKKWLAYGFALVIVLAILLTGSRGGVIGLAAVALAVIAFPLAISKTGELRGFALRSVIAKVAILVALGVGVWGSLPSATRERLATLEDLQHDYNTGQSNASRLVLWRRDIGLALERPIGYGMGAASAADGRAGGQYRTSHNSFVQAFIELGVLGLVLFVYSYCITWKELAKVGRRRLQNRLDPRELGGGHPEQGKAGRRVLQAPVDQGKPGKRAPQHRVDDETAKTALYARALSICLVGNAVAGFFLSQAYSPCLWMIVAVSAAFVRIATTDPTTHNKAARLNKPTGARAVA
jgi:O-antigen ligase